MGTDRFAFAAFQTVGGLPVGGGMDGAVIIVRVPVMVKLPGVHDGKQIRNGNVPGTAVRAVAAGEGRSAAPSLFFRPDSREPCRNN